MEELENQRKYNCLIINGIIFEKIQVFIEENYIELVNSFGFTVAKVYKVDIKVVEIN